jgi:hypothetical protein
VLRDETALAEVIKQLSALTNSTGPIQLLRFKNRFRVPTFNGYRDALMNFQVVLDDGTRMIVELQIHLKQIMEFKKTTHVFYEYFRTYFSGDLGIVAERMAYLESIGSGKKNFAFEDVVELKEELRSQEVEATAAKEKADDAIQSMSLHEVRALREIAAFKSPPQAVVVTGHIVALLINPKTKKFSWQTSGKNFKMKPWQFLEKVKGITVDKFPAPAVKRLRKFLKDPSLANVSKCSAAAHTMCNFAISVIAVYDSMNRMVELSKELSLVNDLTG